MLTVVLNPVKFRIKNIIFSLVSCLWEQINNWLKNDFNIFIETGNNDWYILYIKEISENLLQ